MQTTPYSDTEVVLPQEEGEEGLKVYLFFWETLLQSSQEEHCLSDPMPLLVSPLPLFLLRRGLPDRRIALSPSPQMNARYQPGQSQAGM